jgi:starch-binding outer membrane protein, SusD/RagB family
MKKLIYIFVASIILFSSCEDQLEDKIYDKLVPGLYFQNDNEAIAAVNTLYGVLAGDGWSYYGAGNERMPMGQDAMTDVFAPSAGSGMLYELNYFTWKSDMWLFVQNWKYPYKGISDANYIIEYLPATDGVSDNVKKRVLAEAKTGIAFFYWDLVKSYGDVPLIKSFSDGVKAIPTQTPKSEVIAYALGLLKEAVTDLPISYDEADNGRFTKGACYALMMKFYELNGDNQGVIDATSEIIKLNKYKIVDYYLDIFAANNDQCEEIIFAKQCSQDFNIGNSFLTYCLPNDFKRPEGIDIQHWDSYRARRKFYNSFDSEDARRKTMYTEYENTKGGITVLPDNADVLCLKYGWDPAANIVFGTNDIVILRYADVLLTRAEAITRKSQSVGQEAIDLINEVRNRAFNHNPDKIVKLSDFTNAEELLDWILKERGWELYFEGHRRIDLIRHGKFLSKAQERGAIDVAEFRETWPIPQAELDKNKNLIPTPGY